MRDPIQAPDARTDDLTSGAGSVDVSNLQAPSVQETASPAEGEASPDAPDTDASPDTPGADAPATEGPAPAETAPEETGATAGDGADSISGEAGQPASPPAEAPVSEAPVSEVPASGGVDTAAIEEAEPFLDISKLVEIFNPINAPANIQAFIETGGNVLLVIMIATFVMWALIIERIAFFSMSGEKVKRDAVKAWGARGEHKSWFAHAVREKLISEVDLEATRNINLIKGLVGVAPLLGLLGTVTGMIAVFDVMAITGSSNARLMAAGISKATIPTMAGLVTSLFGIAMMNILDARARRLISETADELLIK